VRDWAAGSGWDKTPPAPALPDDVVAGTRSRYVEAYERITGESFDQWLQRTAP
jgi:phosphoribosylaminoimidazole-succinocarboxamide synthase